MKKILHIVPQLKIIGGMEKYIENFFTAFSEEYNIYVLNIDSGESNIDIGKDRIYLLGEEENNYSLFAKCKKLYVRSKKIAIFCKENNIDILISHGDIPNIFSILSKLWGNKAKIIIIAHNTLGCGAQEKHIYYISKFLYRFADSIVSVSNELSKDLKEKLYLKDIKTIYNPFDFNKIEKLSGEDIEENIHTLIKNKKNIFLHISRLDKNKNQEFLIDCFYEFHRKNPDSLLFIIGEGPQKNKLEKKIYKKNMQEYIFLLGNKKNIYKYITKINYFIFSSKKEGFGRVLIDALSLGIPILTHDYKFGAKEIIRGSNNYSSCIEIEIHTNGILTPYMDEEKFIKGMEHLISNKFNKNNIIKNRDIYSLDNFKKKWYLLLK